MSASAPSTPESTGMTDIDNRLDQTLYRIEYSIRYHQRRESFFDWWDKFAKAIAVLGGAATVVSVVHVDAIRLAIAAAITVTSTLSLVFGFSQKARQHFDLRKRYGQLEAEVLESDIVDSVLLSKWNGKIALIEADEPPPLAALVQISQNDVTRSRGQHDHIHPVGFWRSAFANIFNLSASVKQ